MWFSGSLEVKPFISEPSEHKTLLSSGLGGSWRVWSSQEEVMAWPPGFIPFIPDRSHQLHKEQLKVVLRLNIIVIDLSLFTVRWS